MSGLKRVYHHLPEPCLPPRTHTHTYTVISLSAAVQFDTLVRIMRPFHLVLLALCGGLATVVAQQVPKCPEQHGVQAYAHPELCDHFFKCTNGSVSLEQCENGLLFDGHGNVHNHCNYNWAVKCGDRQVTTLDPISSPGCLYQFGIYPESHECSTNYVKCAHGIPHQTPCEPGLAYDDRTHSCNWPDLMLETCNPEAILGFKCPTKLPSNTQAAKFWPYPRFAIPGDCGRLITCVNNYPRLITCGEGKVFDEENLTCEDPEVVPKCAHHFKK